MKKSQRRDYQEMKKSKIYRIKLNSNKHNDIIWDYTYILPEYEKLTDSKIKLPMAELRTYQSIDIGISHDDINGGESVKTTLFAAPNPFCVAHMPKEIIVATSDKSSYDLDKTVESLFLKFNELFPGFEIIERDIYA